MLITVRACRVETKIKKGSKVIENSSNVFLFSPGSLTNDWREDERSERRKKPKKRKKEEGRKKKRKLRRKRKTKLTKRNHKRTGHYQYVNIQILLTHTHTFFAIMVRRGGLDIKRTRIPWKRSRFLLLSCKSELQLSVLKRKPN